MDVKNYNRNRKKPVRKKGLRIVAFLLLFIGVVLAVFRYYKFMSKSIYEESVSHLTEVLHQSDQMLRELTNKNLTYLHIWGENLQNISGEDEIRDYIKKAQEDAGFLEFFFLSSDGDYKMATGETGYLGLQENIEEDIRQGNDVIANAAVPGKSQLLVFATPKAHGIYQGFEYDAIAIAYENSDIVDVLDISAFDGNAQSFIIHPDGRVVIDHSSELWGNVYNFFGFLSRHSDMSEKEINVLLEKFKAGRTDAMLLNLDGRNYYLVYEKSDIQDWMFLGLVQADIVNASMNNLQFTTMLLVGAVVLCIAAFFISLIIQKNRKNLRRKDVEIRYRDELFQKLSMNVDDVFLMLDAQTYQTDYVSPNAEKLLGITVEQIRKDIRVLRKLHPADSEDSQKNHLKEIPVHEQQEWDCEFIHRKTGERRWFHNIAMGSEVNGEKKYILVMSDRTSDRKMNQALSEAVHAAETANRAKSIFLSNMSHDIRTPMNAIVGLTAIAGANVESQDRVIECLGKITESSRHLLGLINEVLDMARIESGKMTLAQEDFNLSELVDNLITLTKPVLDEHKHNFDIHINHIEHEDVCGDSLRIQQVFVNLMSNAIKYTPDGGNITFSIEEKPNGFSELGCYEFTIEDNGIGMSPEFQKIMFDPFSRADDHRTTRVQGTGLGMAISRNIVNLMNGNIKVESTLHKGTKITVTIYLELQEKEKEQDRNLMNLPVLVVDDDKTCCESTVATLKEIGITGEWVLSGREAVERCYAHHELKNDYFAVILDWKMPDMDGIETARQIRKRIGKEITIIVLTSYEFSEIEEEAKAAGVDAFIAKPLFRSRLTATLRQFTSGRKEKTARNYLDELSEADYTGKRILLVEDNELNREIAVEILQMTGAEVETAENGKIAVEKVEASPKGLYDLIFMDIQMPVMNGYEATAAIRSLPGEQGKLPIVAMTANAFAEDVQLAKNTGMNGHIAKPLDMNKLNDVLENWL